MDNRVGTGSTLARGFGFLFGHIFDVVGLGWLAAVFYAASIFLLIQRLMAALLIAPPATPLVNQFTLPYFAGFLIATAFFGAAMAVAMTRNALGKLDSRAGVYFVYGWKEVRAFWAFLKLYVIAAVLVLAMGIVALNAVPISAIQFPSTERWLGVAPIVWFTGVAVFLTFCVFVFVQARLGFFLAPLAASGERARLRDSWRLGRGNAFAIFIITFAMLVFVFGILAGCYFGFSDSDFNATMIAQRGDPAMWQAISNSAAPIAAICAIALTVLNGLFAGASASAYAQVEGTLERGETNLPEPVHAMAATRRIEPGFFTQGSGEPFAAAAESRHADAQPLNVISEPVSTVAAEAVSPEHVEDVAPEQPLSLSEEITGETTDGETTPPPSSSEAPPAQHAPSEAV
jgi:hypothetical protein